MLITLYARKEPTTDIVAIQHGLGHKQDTVLYRDSACTEVKARWSWYLSSCPKKGQRRATLNCYLWKLKWIDEHAPQEGAAH